MKATVLAFVVAAMAVISSASVQAGVVLSNMGANGLTDTSGPTNTDISGSSVLFLSFTTGSVALTLDWISIVGFNNESGNNKVIALLSDSMDYPDSLLALSTPVGVTTKNVYKFNFSGVNLAASTSYWIQLTQGLSWYIESANAAPTAQNSSGFSYNGVLSSSSGPSAFNYTIGISASPSAPVPEPAITSLVCVAGIAFMRRRMKK
jgi:hypothetical protein